MNRLWWKAFEQKKNSCEAEPFWNIFKDFQYLQNVQSQGNVYCYYNNVLLILSPESPDDFATDVLLIIDWSMDIHDSALIDQYHQWIPPTCHYPIEWLNFKVFKEFIKRKINIKYMMIKYLIILVTMFVTVTFF